MIWVGGRVVPDDALAVSVLDRTFEHGLGPVRDVPDLERSRDPPGPPSEPPRQLGRELGLPLDPAALPDAEAVADLLRANGVEGDACSGSR